MDSAITREAAWLTSPTALVTLVAVIVAAFVYLDQYAFFSYDLMLLSCIIPTVITYAYRSYTGGLNVFYVLERQAQRTPDRPFVLFEGRTSTYHDIYQRSLRIGTWLRTRHHVQKGDIVAMDVQNSDLFIALWFGLWSIGAKPAFINYNLTGQTLEHCITAVKTKLLLADQSVAHQITDDVRNNLSNVEIVSLTPSILTEIEETPAERLPNRSRYESAGHNIAMLIYTSGTTGLPKAAIVSWGKCIVGSMFSSRIIRITPNDVFYTSMPLYHSSGSILGFLAVLAAGSTVSLGRKFSARNFWREVSESNASIIQYVGETGRYLLSTDPQIDSKTGVPYERQHRVRLAFGNGLRPDIWRRFKERFGIRTVVEFYSATEGAFATWNVDVDGFSEGAIGRNGWIYRLIMSWRVRVLDVDALTDTPHRDAKTGRGRTVASGQQGELIFRLPSGKVEREFQGYYGNKGATESKILRNVFSQGDAWFRTGDIVVWDRQGRMYFCDRIGDTFRWKSENVATAEVAHMMGSHPSIREANVYGVLLPHHDGRAGCAAVILSDEEAGLPTSLTSAGPRVLQSLAEHLDQTLPKYARPLFLRVIRDEDHEVTGTNKPIKHKLRTEGVDPTKVTSGRIFWRQGETFVPFEEADWHRIAAGELTL